MRLGRAVRQHLGGQELTRIGSRLQRKRLLPCGDFAGQIASRIFPVLDWEERLASGAIEKKYETLFTGLSHSVDTLALTGNGDKHRRRRKITVPNIVLHCLKMPDATAGLGIESEQAVGKKVIAEAVTSVEIKRSRSGGNVQDSSLRVERHSGPVVRSAAVRPCIFGPGFVSEFSGMWDRVEAPAKFACTDIVGADIARRRREGFRITTSHDENVFVNYRGTGQRNRYRCGIAAQVFAKIDATMIAEALNRLASIGVQHVDKVHHSDDDATVFI